MNSDGVRQRLPSLLAVQQLNGSAPFGSIQARDYRFCTFYFAANAGGGLTFTGKVQDSNEGTIWADLAGASATFTNVQASRSIMIDHQRARPFLRGFITTSGNMSVSAIAVQSGGKSGNAPAPDVLITG